MTMKNMSLVRRITVFVVASLIVCSAGIGVFSYILQRSESITENAKRALSIAQTVAAMLDSEQYVEIMRTKEVNDYYNEYKTFLDKTLEECNLIYLYILDKTYSADVVYFAEGYPAEGRPDEPEICLGDTEATEVYSPEMFHTIQTGQDTVTDIYNLGGYGNMVSGFTPFFDVHGNVLGVVGVDLAVNDAVASSNRFGFFMICIASAICFLIAVVTVRFIKTIVSSLNGIFAGINSMTAQVSGGTKQIAESAQSVAQGSSEQNASIEQLSSIIYTLAEKIKQNTDMAAQASNICTKAKMNAKKSDGKMNQMTLAIREINDANQNIGKVTQLINNIASQTNILALNAAVEAARTGEHGRGFAVVAEEVRSLANKAAEAAKNTGEFIAESIEKVTLGLQIAEETSENLHEIFENISQSTSIVDGMAYSSSEQTAFIDEITQEISQISMVVQENSAAAEEGASVSQEISSQSNMLNAMVEQYKIT